MFFAVANPPAVEDDPMEVIDPRAIIDIYN